MIYLYFNHEKLAWYLGHKGPLSQFVKCGRLFATDDDNSDFRPTCSSVMWPHHPIEKWKKKEKKKEK